MPLRVTLSDSETPLDSSRIFSGLSTQPLCFGVISPFDWIFFLGRYRGRNIHVGGLLVWPIRVWPAVSIHHWGFARMKK
jgi:hypothetical protein